MRSKGVIKNARCPGFYISFGTLGVNQGSNLRPMSRVLYIFRDILILLRTRQADPVVHQAHAGFAVAGNQSVQAFSVDRALVLNLHTVNLVEAELKSIVMDLVEAVLDIGENTAEGLQRLPLGRDDQIPVNATFQSQQRFIKLHLRPII